MTTADTDLLYSASFILSTSSNDLRHQRSTTQLKKPERSIFGRNHVFHDGIGDSFLVSSSLSLTRQDLPRLFPSPNKRYVSSFKTLVHTTNSKPTQRLNYVNDSVMIFKLSKERHQPKSNISNSVPNSIDAQETNSLSNPHFSSKNSTLSLGTSSTTLSTKPPVPPTILTPLLKVEGQKHRIVHHDPSIIVPTPVDLSSPANLMATSTSSQLQANSSVFTYRSAAAGGNTVRQRAIAETTSNSLLISTERLKTNMTTNVRQPKQPLPTATTTTLSSTYVPSQRATKSRIQQEKATNSREVYDYPDPFLNCPQDVLNKLAQLTKLQLETIDWEKKKRFTKKKPLPNGTAQGKDSP